MQWYYLAMVLYAKIMMTGALAGFAVLAAEAPDTPSKFQAECTLSMLGHATFSSACFVEDMPKVGYNNRFRLVIKNPEGTSPMERVADYVSATTTANGHLQVSAILLGFIDVRPLDPDIRFRFTSSAPTWEVRPQNVVTTIASDGALDIQIDEPWGDFNGKEPSQGWLERNQAAQRLRCHAK